MPDDTTAPGGESGGAQESAPVTPEVPPTPAPPADPFAEERSRLEARARSFQSESDRVKLENAELRRAATAPAPSGSGDGTGGDAALTRGDFETFGRNLLRQSIQANDIVRTAETLRVDYKLADPAIFARAADFESADALRIAAMDSHAANQRIVDAAVAEKESALRAEFEAKHGGGAGPAGGDAPAPGDPTAEALSRMTTQEWNDLEKKSPGVIDRVLRSSTSA